MPDGDYVGRKLIKPRDFEIVPELTVVVAEHADMIHVFQRDEDGWYGLGYASEPWRPAAMLQHLAPIWVIVYSPPD
jgi:hypothetical protein